MNKLIGLLLLLTQAFSNNAYGRDSDSTFRVVPQVTTIFPMFLGGGVGVSIAKHFQLDGMFGFTPQPYYQTIGKAAASFGNNESYQDVIEAAFQNNLIWRIGFQYNFKDTYRGWRIGIATSFLTSSGDADIDTVLSAATGQDYSQLKTLLSASGRDTSVDMSGFLVIGDIYGGYAWSLTKKLSFSTTIGFAKVVQSDVNLETGLPLFESSFAGKALLRSTEDELGSIINTYGLSPTASVAVLYVF